MNTFIMTVTFQIGVDILGFVKEFAHNVHCIQEADFVKNRSRFHKNELEQNIKRTWIYKVTQDYI